MVRVEGPVQSSAVQQRRKNNKTISCSTLNTPRIGALEGELGRARDNHRWYILLDLNSRV